jgi:hypothetical protein
MTPDTVPFRLLFEKIRIFVVGFPIDMHTAIFSADRNKKQDKTPTP